MEFNKLVKTKLFPIFQKYGFVMEEELKNVLQFKSSAVEIRIVYNNYENSCFIAIGRIGDTLPLDNNAMKNVFNSTLDIERVTSEKFVSNLSLFFETKEGTEILKGNIAPFIKFRIIEANNYTSQLLQEQTLETAAKAWEANDYGTFVKNIDKVGFSKIPQPYQLKYKIAKQKIVKQ
ncbi:hypothetical protein AGMMS50262_10650 [Bacteroidia bacterium]|nr:hypothetical protein AGMMS50262_10650 [Bacteroidia bacterium]